VREDELLKRKGRRTGLTFDERVQQERLQKQRKSDKRKKREKRK